MSRPGLNFKLRDTDGQLAGNTGWLFTMYWLHCDHLLRCFPSNEKLKIETGIKSGATLRKHRDMLIEMGALVIVPYDLRKTNREKELHPRKYVYQLTGIMNLPDGTLIPTVHFNNPESLDTHISLLEELDFDTDLIYHAFSKPSKIDGLNSEKTDGLNPQKLIVSKIDPKVVHSSTLSKSSEVSTKPPAANAAPVDADAKNGSCELGSKEHLDRLFNIITYGSFNVDVRHAGSEVIKTYAPRVGKIRKGLMNLESPPDGDELKQFYHWYRHKTDDADPPRDSTKFLEWFVEFRQHEKQRAQKHQQMGDTLTDFSGMMSE